MPNATTTTPPSPALQKLITVATEVLAYLQSIEREERAIGLQETASMTGAIRARLNGALTNLQSTPVE